VERKGVGGWGERVCANKWPSSDMEIIGEWNYGGKGREGEKG
jgi:hypothetical protein